MNQRIKIDIAINYQLLRDSKFAIIDSPYRFTKRKIYKVEFDMIEVALKRNNINPINVTDFYYMSGMITPYMIDQKMSIAEDGYHVIITAIIRNQVNTVDIHTDIFIDISNQFNKAFNIDQKKQIYRKLMLQYHPDKETGNLKIAQFINSFKTW